jgi:3-dehydroquinate synthase class II
VRALGTAAGAFVQSLDTAGIAALLSGPDQLALHRAGSQPEIAVHLDAAATTTLPGNADIVVTDAGGPDVAAGFPGARALYGVIAGEDDLAEFARRLTTNGTRYGIVELKDDTNIPLELLIAWFQRMPVKVLKRVQTSAQASVALQTLEWGADGVVLATDDPLEVARVKTLIDAAPLAPLVCCEWEVTRVAQVGAGHRVCVDTVSLLRKDEGMLVGSQSNAFVMMCSETHPLPYMPLRPFRVNAGAVHQYILAPGGRTQYLSEIHSGTECLVADTSGRTRGATVGRAKVEYRPLLLIAFAGGDDRGTVFVQNDWHVRITGAEGEVLNVTDCRPGTKLLGWRTDAARHCGIPVVEELHEQ